MRVDAAARERGTDQIDESGTPNPMTIATVLREGWSFVDRRTWHFHESSTDGRFVKVAVPSVHATS
jgi:hypothetical protein